MYEEHPLYHPPDSETSSTMEVTLYQGQEAPVDTTFKKATFPEKILPPLGKEPMNQVHVRHLAASVTPSTNATAVSTISSMTSSTLRPAIYAGFSHGKIEPNEIPTGNEGKDIFKNVITEGNRPGVW